jgi:NAD+ synthase (glutamine-hydrolysing)
LKEYAGRCGFPGALVALSGGIESAVVAALAVDALGADQVSAVTLPSEVTSRETLGDALELARRLGVRCPETPIKGIFREAEAAVRGAGESLGLPDTGGTLTAENLQSRARGLVAMGLSNRTGRVLLTTGNRSEILTGYCTLYGDTCGGFAAIKDVYKTEVFRLARWRNGAGEVIPESIIARPPSAELREGQKDSDSLPPYDVLDALLAAWLDGGATDRELAAKFPGETVEKVKRLVYRSEFKRRQGAPGVLLREGAGLPLVHGFG